MCEWCACAVHNNNIVARFRSWDLWVMGPPRFHCATTIHLRSSSSIAPAHSMCDVGGRKETLVLLRLAGTGSHHHLGAAGYRSPYLPHAKRALYQVSYNPALTGQDTLSTPGEQTPRLVPGTVHVGQDRDA